MNLQPGVGVLGGANQRNIGGGNQRNNRGGGGLLDQFINPAGVNPNGNIYPGQFSQNPNQGVAPGFMYDANTGQYIQIAPGTNAGPVQQPVMTQTRVYDQATNRIFIQETNQYTGELWDPVNQRAYWPTEPTTTTPAATAAAQPAATPVELPKPAGPPRNYLVAKLKPAAEIIRKQIRAQIRTAGYENFLLDELEATLRPVLFSDADRERLIGLVERKDSVSPDQIENLNNAIEQLDSNGVRLKLDNLQVGRDQYPGAIERIAVTKLYREIGDAGLQSPTRTKQMISRLVSLATKAGLPRDLLRPATQQLEAFSRLDEELDLPVGDDGFDLASVTPETIFTVVRWRGFAANFPVVLASETLLVPASGKGPAANKLTIGTATALELGLPICGSLNPPVPDTSEQVAAPAVGVTFRLDQNAGAEATIYVMEDRVQYVQAQARRYRWPSRIGKASRSPSPTAGGGSRPGRTSARGRMFSVGKTEPGRKPPNPRGS